MTDDKVEAHRLIADFMTASAPLELYLQQQRALTDLEVESLSLTVEGLQMFLNNWKRKHGKN